MSSQLNEKLVKQDESLSREKCVSQSPLCIQRKQLQKDLDDWKVLMNRSDARRVQEIIDRVEHISLFTRKVEVKEIRPTCAYRVRLRLAKRGRFSPGLSL